MRVIVALLLFALSAGVWAAETTSEPSYSLSVGRVYQPKAGKPDHVFILGGSSPVRGGEIVCNDAASLLALVKSLPRGAKLDWYPTCDGTAAGALMSDLGSLRKACQDAGILFTIHPAG